MMSESKTIKADALKDWVGRETGLSDWLLIDQERINAFADVTEDHQFIHVDPQAAALTPLGGTIAHGFLLVSILSRCAALGGVLIVEDARFGLNYGFDKLRFMSPVRAGKQVRGRFTLMDVNERVPGQIRMKYAVRLEIEGEEKPALAAEWIVLAFL